MKVIVIGINHAGTSAVRTLLAQNPDLEVHAYDRNTNISFLGCGIALAVGGIVKDPKDLFYCDQISLEGMGASIFMEHDVTAVDTNTKSITAKNLKTDLCCRFLAFGYPRYSGRKRKLGECDDVQALPACGRADQKSR